MKQIVMCPPENFDVIYEINPWMKGNIETVNHTRAAAQWCEVRNALIAAGADVIVSPTPPEDCPDAVFMANAGLVFKDMFIPSRFKHPERQVEEPYFENWFDSKDFIVATFLQPESGRLSFEGAGDALFSHDRKHLWMGYGFRTSGDFKFTLDILTEDTGAIVRPLQLVDPRWYHLDTCFCPLDTGDVLWYPKAFSPHAQHVVRTWYDSGKLIEVSEQDALGFACNAVSVGANIVTPIISDGLSSLLADRGYTVRQVDMSQFLRSGGACKCLTLELVE